MATRWARPNHLAEVDVLGDWYGLAGDAIPPTRAEAMTVPAMARARHLVCTAARLPLVITPGDYRYRALIDQPDPTRTREAVLTDTLDDLIFHGVSLWLVTDRYAHDGRPRRARHVRHGTWTRDHDGRVQVDDRPAAAEDLVWFEGPHEGVLRFGGRALRSAVRLDRAYNATSEAPAVAWELHQTSRDILTDDEKSALVAAAKRAIATRGGMYTNEAVELRIHQQNTGENLLVKGRNAAAVEIARMVGLPAPLLDAPVEGSSGTYQNVHARLREARDLGVGAYADAVTARLSLDDLLPHGVTVAWWWDALLRADFADRMNGYAAAQAAGVYTADECRALERGPALEGTTP